MTYEDLLRLIGEGEGQRLEFKRGVPSVKDLALAVVCFANAEGGNILLGVDEQGEISGCEEYDIPELVSGIYRSTVPSITVEIEEIETPEGTILVVSVPRSLFVHSTTGGEYKKRVGKECLPMPPHEITAQQAARGTLDYSTLIVSGANHPDDVDLQAFRRLRSEIEYRNPAMASQSDVDLLKNLGLLVLQDDGEGLTIAALLLVGKKESTRTFLPQGEVLYLRQTTVTEISYREALYLPLPKLLDRLEELIDAANEIHSIQFGLVRIDIPDFSKRAYREAILNAISHRNYALPGGITIRHFRNRIEVSSPGGLPEGVSTSNILRRVVPRNRLLADVLQRIGYVERAGIGVDLMFKEQLRLGKEPPEFDVDPTNVRLILYNASFDERFVTFVEGAIRQGVRLELDELIILNYLRKHYELDRGIAATILQRREREASEILSSMSRRRLLQRRGIKKATVYRLSDKVTEELGPIRDERLIEAARYEEIVLRFVREQGSITNRDCRDLCGLSRAQAWRLLTQMVKGGTLIPKGETKGRIYIISK